MLDLNIKKVVFVVVGFFFENTKTSLKYMIQFWDEKFKVNYLRGKKAY